MIVVDASAMVEALVGVDASAELLDALVDDVHAPHLLDVEVMSLLRGLCLGGRLEVDRAEDGWQDFGDLMITRHTLGPLAGTVWTLRHQFTSYDANYLALAEALDAELITCDTKLATDGNDARVRVFTRSG